MKKEVLKKAKKSLSELLLILCKNRATGLRVKYTVFAGNKLFL